MCSHFCMLRMKIFEIVGGIAVVCCMCVDAQNVSIPKSALRPAKELAIRPQILVFDPRQGGSSGNPGLKLRISPKGLNYANRVAGDLLNAEIRKIKIPDFEKSIKKGKVAAKNVRITEFNPPTYKISLNSPNRVGWSTDGGKISIKGKWSGRRKVTFFTLKGSGSFTASASDLEISLSTNFRKNSQGRPVMTGVSCSAKVRSLSVKIKGGIVGWVLNLFRGKIANKLKPYLESAVCKEGKKFVESDVNAKLRTFPITASLGRFFKLNYRLSHHPSISQGSIMSSHDGEISYLGRGGASFHPHSLVTSRSNGRMLYLYGSDYILNSFLQSAHKNNKMRYTVNERNLPNVAKYLRTSCSNSVCLGTLFPEIEAQYPNATGFLRFATTGEPTVVFSVGKATASGKGKAELFVQNPSNGTVRILAMNMTVGADLKPHLSSDFRRAFGTLKVNNLAVTGLESQIADFTQSDIQNLINFATPILEELVNKSLRRGIVIPLTRGVRLRNGRLRLLKRTAEISADVLYST